jgi:hypothetical protein
MQKEKPIKDEPVFFCTPDFCMKPDAVPEDLQEEIIIQHPIDKPLNDQGESR